MSSIDIKPFAYRSISVIRKHSFSRLLMLKAYFKIFYQYSFASITRFASSSESKDEHGVIGKNGLLY
jgi:hypothetical protein